MDSTNIFRWASSELSQDAFICWLMSFALKENHGKNPELESCALDLLHKIPGLETASEVSSVQKQVYNVDVMLTVGEYCVIIEDKVFADTYDGQIQGYKQNLIQYNGTDPDKILCVLYKISEQPQPEQGVDYEFTRGILLEVMRPYKSKCKSDLFAYYVDRLEYLEDVSQFDKHPISEWGAEYGEAYKRFFSSLKREKILPKDRNWFRVNNPSGGFWGFCWDFVNDIDPSGSVFDSIYLQIEDNIIAVKIAADPIDDYDYQKITDARWKILNTLMTALKVSQKRRSAAEII